MLKNTPLKSVQGGGVGPKKRGRTSPWTPGDDAGEDPAKRGDKPKISGPMDKIQTKFKVLSLKK